MKKVILYILLTAFLFSTIEVALKLGGDQLDSFQITFLRFMGGGLVLLPFALDECRRNQTRISGKDYLYLLLLGIVCIPLSMLFYQLGIMKANASTVALIICTNPLYIMLFAHFIAGEKMAKRNVIGVAVGLFGIVFMVNPFHMQAGNTPEGILLALAGAILFSLYSVMGKLSVGRIGIMTQTSLSFIFGSLVLYAILLMTGKPVLEGVWPENIWLVLYLSIFTTGLGYLFYFLAMKNSDATTASITFLVKPAIAPLLAVLILGDVINFNGYVGIALVLVSSIINIGGKREQIEREQVEY